MKNGTCRFQVKLFLLVVCACCCFAALIAWLTGLKFWILFSILFGAVLVNGLIAKIDDEESEEK